VFKNALILETTSETNVGAGYEVPPLVLRSAVLGLSIARSTGYEVPLQMLAEYCCG
jgi:UPF0716 family protein affecting phage T7 exclusion